MPARLAASCLAAVLAPLPISPSAAQSAAGTTLRFVPHADLAILDPYFTGTYITRNYGYMVFDTLLAMDSAQTPAADGR